MWEKFKAWLKKRQDEKTLKLETELWEELLGCKIVPGSVHVCTGLLASVYFNQDKECQIVDFSQWEKTGLAHFMLFTTDSAEKYRAEKRINEQDVITTYIPEAIVFMRKYEEGEGWCFR
jgi:hypothetical protein